MKVYLAELRAERSVHATLESAGRWVGERDEEIRFQPYGDDHWNMIVPGRFSAVGHVWCMEVLP